MGQSSTSCRRRCTELPAHRGSEPGIIAGTVVRRSREVEAGEEKRIDDLLAKIMAVAVEFGEQVVRLDDELGICR